MSKPRYNRAGMQVGGQMTESEIKKLEKAEAKAQKAAKKAAKK